MRSGPSLVASTTMVPPVMVHTSPIVSDADTVGLTLSANGSLEDTDIAAPPTGVTDIDDAGDAATFMLTLGVAPTVSEADGRGVTVKDRQPIAITD